MELSAIATGIKDVGFPVAVAAAALYVCYRLITRMLDTHEKQTAEREAAHREERKADRDAHLEALKEVGTAVHAVHEDVRDVLQAVTPTLRRGG